MKDGTSKTEQDTDRRAADRRKANDAGYSGPDRRKHERRKMTEGSPD